VFVVAGMFAAGIQDHDATLALADFEHTAALDPRSAEQVIRLTQSAVARGAVGIAKGPWFTSGNWWRTDAWNREEWDIALRSGALYRIFRDLRNEAWFVEGNYD